MTKEERLILDGVDDPILFYGKNCEYSWMSNFSSHSLQMFNPFTGKFSIYKTAEHRFQSMKATTLEDHEFVRSANSPGLAKQYGRSITLKTGWGDNYGDLCYYVMLETILEKVKQGMYIESMLKQTQKSTIYEDAPNDNIWGWKKGNNYSGKNLLGICWMEARRYLI